MAGSGLMPCIQSGGDSAPPIGNPEARRAIEVLRETYRSGSPVQNRAVGPIETEKLSIVKFGSDESILV